MSDGAAPVSSASRKTKVIPPPWRMLLTTRVAAISRRSRCVRICWPNRAGNGVGHLLEQLVALLRGQVALGHDVVEEDLDVDLMVGAVHAGGVVDRVVVDAAAGERELDAAALCQAEVAALTDDLATQLA